MNNEKNLFKFTHQWIEDWGWPSDRCTFIFNKTQNKGTFFNEFIGMHEYWYTIFAKEFIPFSKTKFFENDTKTLKHVWSYGIKLEKIETMNIEFLDMFPYMEEIYTYNYPVAWAPSVYSYHGGYAFSYMILIISLIIGLFIVLILAFFARNAGTSYNVVALVKRAPYECGFQPFEKLDRCTLFLFYRLAVFFIIFEAELIFLYPWATAITFTCGNINFFFSAIPFLFILLVGFLWEIEKGALELLFYI